MAKPSISPNSSSSPLFERLFEEPLVELSKSLEDQNVELTIVLGVQPLSYHPPTFNLGSFADLGPESLDNPVRTPNNSSIIDN